MAQHFDPRSAPFDRLTAEEVGVVGDSLDIAYFRPGETIIARSGAPESLFIVIKGAVEERDADDLVALRGPGDSFDCRALVQGRSSNAFVAREETLCNLLPRDLTLRLINENPRFASFFYLDIARKLDAASSEEEAARFTPLLDARVDELFLHPAVFVDADGVDRRGRRADAGAQDLRAVRRERRGRRHRHPDRSPATRPSSTACRSTARSVRSRIARSSRVAPDDLVSTALLQMTKHNKRRVAVVETRRRIVGILEDIDLLSFLAGNSQLVGGRIDRARRVADLARAAREIEPQTRMLRRQGVKIDLVCEIVSDLNRQLLAQAFRARRAAIRRGKRAASS